MRTALIVLLSCASLSLAQDMKIAPPAKVVPPAQAEPQDPAANPDEAQFKRLASVTWDLNTHKLVWVVEQGTQLNGQFVPKSTSRYEVSPSEAFMAANDQKRGIADAEASSLHDLLSVLSMYCVESTVWWENGADGPDNKTAPAKPAPTGTKPGVKTSPDTKNTPDPGAKPTRVDQPQQSPKAPMIPGARIAW